MTPQPGKTETVRYLVERIHVRTLEQNPLGAPADRDLAIYLPPDYPRAKTQRYPVVYFLHGYSGNNRGFSVYPTLEANPNLPTSLMPPALVQQIDLARLPSYQAFDRLIQEKRLPPFIFVQPDGSLHQPNKFGLKTATGEAITKGSFYVNSPYTGNYENYILEIIQYVDSHYRTYSEPASRVIAGGSMGGYGALRLALRHPQLFHYAAVLSPGEHGVAVDALNHKLRIPIYEALFGPEFAAKHCDALWEDILDTLDLIYSKDCPLLPTVQRDASGKILSFSREAAENIHRGSLLFLLSQLGKHGTEHFKNLRVYLSCEKHDEFGLAPAATKLHQELQKLRIPHHFNLFDDAKAGLTPHILGIAYQITPALQYCLTSNSTAQRREPKGMCKAT
jgi:enterochelin esterase-like enzyme